MNPELPQQLQNDPEHVVGLVTVGQLNSLLESGHITASAAALLCPSSALHLLKPPAFMSPSCALHLLVPDFMHQTTVSTEA